MMIKILIENSKVILLWKKMWKERRFVCVKIVEKDVYLLRGMKPSSILKKVHPKPQKNWKNYFTNFTDQLV